jgi:hypothetical protein
VLDRVVEPQLALARELEDDGRDERLRDAADPKAVTGARTDVTGDDRVAARKTHGSITVTNEEHRAGNPRGDDAVERLLQRRRIRGCCNRSLDDDADQDAAERGSCPNAHGHLLRGLKLAFPDWWSYC